MKDILCSIVVCTYDRPEMLDRCLSSFLPEVSDYSQSLEILVIDNTETGNARGVVESFLHRIPGIRYIHEAKTGLSHARNRGMKEALGDFIFFIDDDAWVAEGFVDRLLNTAGSSLFDVFGAHVEGHKAKNAPAWVKASYYHPQPFEKQRGLMKNGYIQGGASGYRTDMLRLVGGFDVKLGMHGTRIAYGEDTALEKRLRTKRARIGFDPELIVHHEIKYDTVAGIVSSHYKRAVAFYSIYEERLYGNVTRSVLSCTARGFKNIVTGFYKWLFNKDFSLANWFVESMFPFLRAVAILKTGGPQFLNKTHQEYYRGEKALERTLASANSRLADLRFVQIGACDGVSFDPIHKSIKRYGWSGTVVEPLPHLIKDLEMNYRSNSGVQIAPVAVMDRDEVMEMAYVKNDAPGIPDWAKGIGSFRPDRNALNPIMGLNDEWRQHIAKMNVETMRWTSFVEKYAIDKVDLLVLDVEGAEYDILKQVDPLPPIIIFEFINLPVHELVWIKEELAKQEPGYFLIRYNSTDLIAVRKDLISISQRLSLNLPI